METSDIKEIMGLLIALIAVGGGLAIGFISVKISIVEDMKKQLATLEARNKERMALIERGLDANQADARRNRRSNGPLMWGLLLIGVALGVLNGYLLSYSGVGERTFMMNVLGLLFGGIALLIFYKTTKKTDSEQSV